MRDARIRKTRWFFSNKDEFMGQLKKDIGAVIRKANRENKIPTVRLNGTSDIPWERVKTKDGISIFEHFPDLQFYDYTKRPNRHNLPDNYHLTFSLSEDNDDLAKRSLEDGMNVAVVFRNELPEKFWGYPVHDGDETDLRFLDPDGHIIGLKAKGTAKRDDTGFVR